LRLVPALTAIAVLVFLPACSDIGEVSPPLIDEHLAPLVQTLNGQVQGTHSEYNSNVAVFYGLPYASPPLDSLRWAPPQAPVSWQQTRPASTPGAACTQATNSSTFVWKRGDFTYSEDCLFLNIWSASLDGTLPVMVWFHGGAHTAGMAHEKIFDGTTLAQHGVILVSVNYRLGPFGFLAHPWLAQSSSHNSSGNYGLLDKIAALNWLRDNIAQFGGDPNNITIFGQSAGAQSVCSLMASPLARGLFHKAIGQSAACTGPTADQDANGELRGSNLVAALSQVQSLHDLRKESAQNIANAAQHTGWATQPRIVIDGWVLTEAPAKTFSQGKHARVPLLLGSLADEGNELFPLNEAMTEAQLNDYLSSVAGSRAEELRRLYAEQLTYSPAHVQREIITDQFMTLGMRQWASYNHRAGAPTYLYFMDHIPPAFHLYMPQHPQMDLVNGPRSAGAYHSGDLAYVFGTTKSIGVDWQDDDHTLSELMMQYWTHFATHGDPNPPNASIPKWAPYGTDKHLTQLLNKQAHTIEGVRPDKLAFLEEIMPLMSGDG